MQGYRRFVAAQLRNQMAASTQIHGFDNTSLTLGAARPCPEATPYVIHAGDVVRSRAEFGEPLDVGELSGPRYAYAVEDRNLKVLRKFKEYTELRDTNACGTLIS